MLNGLIKVLRYLDNDLQGQELNELLTHLEACGDCRTALEGGACVVDLLHRWSKAKKYYASLCSESIHDFYAKDMHFSTPAI
jgi:hypothetical protein